MPFAVTKLAPKPLVSCRAAALAGTLTVPGDKSISHRALMLGGVALGETVITGLLESEDVARTAVAMTALGAEIERRGDGTWAVAGRGVGGLAEPGDIIDMGNAGTGARLLMGLVASHPLTAVITGDASLRTRPMARVIAPLERIGATFAARAGGRLPVTVTGTAEPMPIEYRLPMASAQVKSAVLLAGLNTAGRTTVIEPQPSRDHTELMLRHFGQPVDIEPGEDGARMVSVRGEGELLARDVRVPGDFSSAAYPLVAALLVAGSRLTIAGVGVNPLRCGLLECLDEMGADITRTNGRQQAGEAVADLVVAAGRLSGIDVPAQRAPSMIDEYPILAIAAASAEGPTWMHGLGELRVKESDRLAGIVQGLSDCGVRVEQVGDSLCVHGTGMPPRGGGLIRARLDHRIAMSFLVLGMAADSPVQIDDAAPIDTSFPGFAELMNSLGADIQNFEEPAIS